jgi:ribosomal protein L15E
MFDTLVKSLVLIVDEVIAQFEKTSKEQIVKSGMKQKVSCYRFQICVVRHGELEVPSHRLA